MTSPMKRIYYRMEISLKTPLCVSNGMSVETDCDVIRDEEGNPFVPGSSLAGAFRSYVEEQDVGQNQSGAEEIFGERNRDDGRMSRLWVNDLWFDTEPIISVRDGVKLENKVSVAKSKYDYEILEWGLGIVRMEALIWEAGMEDKIEQGILTFAKGINQGEIRLGAKKTSGLGKLQVLKLSKKSFSKENVEEWISFDWKNWKDDPDFDLTQKIGQQEVRTDYVTLRVPLTLTGALSIRQYGVKKGMPDFVSLMSHRDCVDPAKEGTKKKEMDSVAVIPGTSVKGAIRQRGKEILTQLGGTFEMLGAYECFGGYVEENLRPGRKKQKEIRNKKSDIIVTESQMSPDTRSVILVRNKISRFENAVVDGGLYTEQAAALGRTVLEIKVKNDKADSEWIIGLLLLAIKDLQHGYLSIGGCAAIGHGIFKENGEIEIDCYGTNADVGENQKEEKSESQLQSYYLTKLREGIKHYGNC